MSGLNLFITGATGYIGGTVLYKILHDSNLKDIQITAIVRTPGKSELLKKSVKEDTGRDIKTVIGNLNDISKLKEQYEAADIVVTTADVDHVESAAALAEVAKQKKKPFYILHTSGTSVLGDKLAKDKKPVTEPLSDIKDNDKITSLPDEQPHRPVDKQILSIQEANPEYVKTIIIAPPAIFGIGDGYDHRLSAQIPLLIKFSIGHGQAFSVYDGNYIWNHVHVRDLANLYTLLLEKLLAGDKDVKTGKEGYYFAEVGSHIWKDVSAQVASTLFTREISKKKGVAELDPDVVAELAGFPFAPYLWGTNSYSKAELAPKLGWKPKYDDKAFWQDIEDEADYIINPDTLKNAPRSQS